MEKDDIIVFRKFGDPMDAHIVKSKLDAYGIPCYLTEENLTQLTTPLLSGGVRLHIFKKDEERVQQLLDEIHLSKVDDDEVIICPRCHSRRIIQLHKNTAYGHLIQALFGFLMGVRKSHYCQDCNHEFDL